MQKIVLETRGTRKKAVAVPASCDRSLRSKLRKVKRMTSSALESSQRSEESSAEHKTSMEILVKKRQGGSLEAWSWPLALKIRRWIQSSRLIRQSVGASSQM